VTSAYRKYALFVRLWANEKRMLTLSGFITRYATSGWIIQRCAIRRSSLRWRFWSYLLFSGDLLHFDGNVPMGSTFGDGKDVAARRNHSTPASESALESRTCAGDKYGHRRRIAAHE
jgi:hypothetical protein